MPDDFDPTVPRHRQGRQPVPPPDPPSTVRPSDPGRSRLQPSGRTTRAGSGASTISEDTLANTVAGDRKVTIGGFRVGVELGRGGMGTVRLAEDPVLRRELAIKFLRMVEPQDIEMFLEEAQITAQLEHPNVVPVHQVGHDDNGLPWLAMKRIEGQSLKELIREWRGAPGPVGRDLPRILTIFGKLCDAVSFAHSRGVIHRDIKPGNVMVGQFGEVLLVDWGLARSLATPDRAPTRRISTLRDEPDSSSRTVQGEVFGTPGYMPPEQARGQVRTIDERSDVFALGGVLYSLLTLEVPYDAERATDAVIAARTCDLVPPRRRAPGRKIPRELAAIVMKAMAEKPSRRYQRVAELQADLDAWQAYRRTTAWRSGPVEAITKWVRRNPTAAMSAAMLMFCALVAVAFWSQLQAAEEKRLAAEAREQLAEAQRRAAQRVADAESARAEELAGIASENLSADARAAIGHLRRLLGQQRNNPSHGLSIPRREIEYMLGAVNDLFRVRELAGEQPTAEDYHMRAVIRSETGDKPGAVEDLLAMHAIDDTKHWSWLMLGNLCNAIGRSDDALAAFNRGVELAPRNTSLLVNRGNCLRKRGDFDAALADFDAAIDADPQFYEAWYSRGDLWMVRGDWAKAVEEFTRGLAIHPTRSGMRVNRAMCYLKMGQPQLALEDTNVVVEHDPGNASGYSRRGEAWLALRKPDLALADYQKVVELEPRNHQAINQVGNCLAAMRKLPEAEQWYTKALEITRDEGEIWHNRALVRDRMGRKHDALADLHELFRVLPDHAKGHVLYGTVLADLGRIDEGMAALRRAMELDPRLWQAPANLATMETRRGNREEAIRMLTIAWRACPNRRVRDQMAAEIRKLGGQPPR